MSLTTLTTASILLCLTCTRTVISSLVHEYEIIIRAVSGLLAGIAVHIAATPTLLPHGRRRHRIDDSKITTVFILLSLYALFDILIAQHIIWGIFPYLGWTTSFVLQSSQDDEYYSGRYERRTTESSGSKKDSTDTVVVSQKRYRPRNTGEAAFNKSSSSPREARQLDAGIKATEAKQSSESFRGAALTTSNANAFQYQDKPERVKVYPSEATRYTNRPRVGSSHVTFVDTATTRHPIPIHKEAARISGETKEAISSGNSRNPSLRDAAPAVAVLQTPASLLPLTRNNIRKVAQSPKHSEDEGGRHKTVLSVDSLVFHTAAELACSDSDADSDYTLARTTFQSEASSSTTRASLDLAIEENFIPGPSAAAENIDDDLSIAKESSSDNGIDIAPILFNAVQNQAAKPVELKPDLIPQDYVSQTYVRVEKFVSAVDGTELAEQIEVIPGEPQENGYDRSELRSQRRHLQSLLVYEPSETSSSTTVRLSELEGNIKAIDRRAEGHRRKSLEAKRKASALGEKRKDALRNRRSNEAFRMKCAMREYAKEADREDKKAAKLFFRARNRPGTSRIDVHLLRKEEALKAAEKALREVQLKGGRQLHVIVGQGIHSAKGKSVLKPFLKSMFEAQKMRVYESSSNPGMLIINMK